MKNERRTIEEQCRNWLQSRFNDIFSSSFLFFLLNSGPLDHGTSFLQPPHTYLEHMRGGGCTAAHQGELVAFSRSNLACPGDLSLPRRASYFSLKLSSGPGKPEASLDEPGAWKSHQMTILPSLLGIFHILFLNVEKPYRLCGNWC